MKIVLAAGVAAMFCTGCASPGAVNHRTDSYTTPSIDPNSQQTIIPPPMPMYDPNTGTNVAQ